MKKMFLLAAMVAIAAMMMAAAPAMADDNDGDGRDDDYCHFFDCDDNNKDFCDFFDCRDDFCDFFDCRDDHNDDDFCDFFDCRDDHNDDDFCDFFDCRDDHNNNNFVPAVTQDFEQEAESGDVDQSFDVSGTGDNSNQTVGIQGVANTGNAQNQIGVIDAGGFGDFDANNDDERFFFVDDFCDFGDFDGDGICDRLDRLEDRFEDRCENGDHDGDGFCDRLEDRIEDLEDRVDDGFFFVADDFDNDDDRFFVNDGSDFEFEDVGATIELSPTNTVTSDQQVNQAAAAFGK
jgi:hypothetical protein